MDLIALNIAEWYVTRTPMLQIHKILSSRRGLGHSPSGGLPDQVRQRRRREIVCRAVFPGEKKASAS